MPIKPENLKRYPKDWKAISAAARERAGHRCQWKGCGVANHAIGFWEMDGGPHFVQLCMRADLVSFDEGAKDALLDQDRADGHKVIEIVLTVAHLDHTPENCKPANLQVWCQRHHLAYDRRQHVTSAYMSRMTGRRNLELAL